MPVPYATYTRSDGELITNTTYNADHQLHVTHNTPGSIDDASSDTTAMRAQTDPGSVGGESLATSLLGELERLRFTLAKRFGLLYWYQQAASFSFVKGLLGVNNPTTPLTKYDLLSPLIVGGSLVSGSMVDVNFTTLTVDIGLAGPAANGRDQAGAFSANSWVHLYYILGNAVTTATIASTVEPTVNTGPTLPSGYTNWAYACSLRLNASTQFLRTRTCSGWVFYEVDENSTTRILNNGVATSFTNVSMTALVPAFSTQVLLNARLALVHNALTTFTLALRPTSAAHMTAGVIAAALDVQVVSQSVACATWAKWLISNAAMDYKLSSAPSTSGGAILEVLGYLVPNGAE